MALEKSVGCINNGTTEQRCNGAKVQWCNGATVEIMVTKIVKQIYDN